MKDKCNVCKVMCEISRSDKPRACAFEHNGDENICPFDARYLDLSKHDKQIRADAIEEVKESINEHLFNSPMINPIMTRNEILLFLEQLKGAENE